MSTSLAKLQAYGAFEGAMLNSIRGFVRAVSTVLIVSSTLSPATAGKADEECSCRNLESLQQELDNANYLRDAFRKMAEQLRQKEQQWAEAKKDPTHPDSGINIKSSSQSLKGQLAEGMKKGLPHPVVKDNTSPAEIDMKQGECKNAMLEKLREGAPCKGIADAVLKHEQTHLRQCEAMGKEAYWDRPGSEFADEEAERYAEQVEDIREQLRRVIDGSAVTVEAQLEPRISGPQFDVTYSYVTSLAELKGKAEPGSDTWTLNGRAVRTTTIKRAKVAGMTCTGSGALKHEVAYSLETDGKTMSLNDTTTSQSGAVKLSCKGGIGMSNMPLGEMGSGPVFSNFPLQAETNFSEEVADMAFGKLIKQNGFSASGKHTVLVKLICPGQGN